MSGQEKVQPRRLKGFQDYHPEVMEARYKFMNIILNEARTAGFKAIGTPTLEYSDVLLGVGGETDKQVFRFLDNGDRDVALRFDLTVPFARYVSEHQGKLSFPFKRIQIGDVWRAEKPQKGRYREFCQCDLDIVGVNSCEADIEVIQCFLTIINNIGVGPFTVSIGHRGVLSSLIKNLFGNIESSLETQFLIILDKLDKIGRKAVEESLLALDPQFSKKATEQLLDILTTKFEDEHTQHETLKNLFAAGSEESQEVEELLMVVAILNETASSGQGKVCLDLSIARGLGYYTGIVFETTIDALPKMGSVCSGGRYNKLLERYSKNELPGIGGSIGLDRMLACMNELKLIEPYVPEHKTVFIVLANDKARLVGFKLLNDLRSSGITAEITLKIKKLGAQFKLANRLGYPAVVTIGDDEIQSQTFTVKNMLTGSEAKGLSLEESKKRLKDILTTDR